ncbi:MAG TPA: phosphatase PAP2 family protein [Rhizomicrobium sp.]|nr:phosphatase PAP2 family protein [Rhizomicrobium sp.]
MSSNDLTTLARIFSFVGSAFVWLPAALMATGSLWLLQRRKPALAMVATMLGAILLDNGLKFLFHRARPEVFFGVSPDTYSFPSGHALFATCFYGAFAALLAPQLENWLPRIALWITAVLMMLGIGWSRIYLGVHFPSDVLAGYLVGATWLVALTESGAFQASGGITMRKS